jgi:site-specific recombinase XerD
MRVSELCHLKPDDIWLEEGMLKVLGKGNKERLIPIGKQVQRLLWRYISRFRPDPATANSVFLFLTRDGRSMTKDRVEKIMAYYGRRAELKGVRCSPHTLRHTAAVKFLRNGGDVFSLQRILGHASLEMTRRYCELADIDVKRAHMTASPVDNLCIHYRR